MQLLEECIVANGLRSTSLRLYRGDLASIPSEEAVDCLVVSAFPNDYVPTPTSLIGALARRGISVQELAGEKEQDLRQSFSCWISKDLGARYPRAGFRRLLCFEPLTRGNPAELTGDVFAALMPFVLGDSPIKSVAMPVLASGDQRFDDTAMFESLFRATVWWLSNGMPVDVVKIVVHSDASAGRLRTLFRKLQTDIPQQPEAKISHAHMELGERFDCFVSYSRHDSDAADRLMAVLSQTPGLRVFRDKVSIQPGESWQSKIDEALEHSRKIIALYSPSYLQSPMCKEEFNLARIRHRNSNDTVLVPIYLRTTELPLYMQSINYIDCREADAALIESCGPALRAALT
jgi:hypothetical protein